MCSSHSRCAISAADFRGGDARRGRILRQRGHPGVAWLIFWHDVARFIQACGCRECADCDPVAVTQLDWLSCGSAGSHCCPCRSCSGFVKCFTGFLILWPDSLMKSITFCSRRSRSLYSSSMPDVILQLSFVYRMIAKYHAMLAKTTMGKNTSTSAGSYVCL